MPAPNDRRYTDSHEWHLRDGNVVTIGITRFAVDELTDITYVELPDANQRIEAGNTAGEIESVKTTSELYAAVSGKVVQVNEKVKEDPAAVNEDPYGDGWLFRVEVDDPSELDALMDAAAYNEKYPTQ